MFGPNDLRESEVIVKDPTGALISKAQVQLIRNGKSQSLNSTNQRGEVRFNKVPAGSYQLRVEAAGFKAQDVDLDLAAGPHRQEVTLEIDVIKVDVDVEEEAQVRNTNPNGAAFSNVLTANRSRNCLTIRTSLRTPSTSSPARARRFASTDFAAANSRRSRRFARFVSA
jgi:hypothetical protein